MSGTMQPPSAVERMIGYLREIARPMWYSMANNALNAVLISGTVTTVTTVTTLTNQSQVGGVDAKTAYADQIMLNTWCNAVRALIT